MFSCLKSSMLKQIGLKCLANVKSLLKHLIILNQSTSYAELTHDAIRGSAASLLTPVKFTAQLPTFLSDC